MSNRILIALIPAFLFLSLLFFLWRGLSIKPEILPSALVGKPAPHFHLSNLMSPAYPFTEQNFKGQVTLLNVWASWCYACEIEHPFLMELKEKYHLPIYGIAYKDKPNNINLFLNELGNPYSMLGDDRTGSVAMDFGVYGTPETFILNKKGLIVYRHVGVINQQVWEDELLPLIQALK